MHALKRLFTCLSSALLVTLLLLSCRSIEKSAVSCPDFSDSRRVETVHHKTGKHNTFTAGNRFVLRSHPARQKSISGSNHSDSGLKIKPDIKNGLMSSGQDFINSINKKQFISRLSASVGNTIIPQYAGCDTIFLKSGIWMNVKIDRVKSNKVFFRNCENLTGPSNSISKSEISSIKYTNGQRDIFARPVYGNIVTGNEKIDPVGLIGFVSVLTALVLIQPLLLYVPLLFLILLISAPILGAVSLRRIRNHPEKYKGRKLALATIISSLVAIALILFFMILLIVSFSHGDF